jgi:AcrR family transcriptional regulator
MARPSDPHAKIDLLRAAEAVFVERGLDLAKVEDITARAGKSKGAFYLHFDGKEEAFRQIVETMLARLSTCLEDPPFQNADLGAETPREVLERLLEKDVEVFEFLWQNRGVVRLALEGGRSASFGYLMDEFAERTRVQGKLALAAGVELGLFRPDLDVEVASLATAGAYDRVAREVVRAERKPNLPRLIGELQRLVFAGVGSAALLGALDRLVRNPPPAAASPGRAPRTARSPDHRRRSRKR